MGTINSIYVIVGLIVLIVGFSATIFRGISVLWKISGSVTTAQESLKSVEKDLTEIKITMSKESERIEKVDKQSAFNERDLQTAFKRIDECKTDTEKTVAQTKYDLKEAIEEIKRNCAEIQAEKRKVKLG